MPLGTVKYIIIFLLLADSIGLAWFFNWRYKRLTVLESSGLSAKATIDKVQSHKDKNGSWLRVFYNFHVPTGEQYSGKLSVPYTEEHNLLYAEGSQHISIYSSEKPSFNTLKRNLSQQIKSAEILRKISPLIIASAIMGTFIIWFYFPK